MDSKERLSSFYGTLKDIYHFGSIGALLGWDQQTYMPPKAANGRAEQQEALSRLLHQKFTNPAFVAVTNELAAELPALSKDDQVNVRETKRELDRTLKLTEDFVAERTRVHSLSYVAWTKARPSNNFKEMQPHLEKIVELSRREADLVGFEGSAYNALLDVYEPHARIEDVKPLLMKLGEGLSALIPAITAKQSEVPELKGEFPEELQTKFCMKVLKDIGYDFAAGRLDKTHHPFESSVGPQDVRVTTRYQADNYLSGLFTALHEGGHALYEQGLPTSAKGTPLGSPVSLGIHESQSRFWENLVGRSHQFSQYLHSALKNVFPAEHSRLKPADIWQLVNRVRPSLIRVEADEVTYSLHVVIRMLLEESLISGELKVADLPGAWNDLYRKYLGVEVLDDKDGVLQDVHWYSGMIGYFPTYALGNLYGAMLLEACRAAILDYDQCLEEGEFEPIKTWLWHSVHKQGMRYTAPELIKKITGAEVSEQPFLNYVRSKFHL